MVEGGVVWGVFVVWIYCFVVDWLVFVIVKVICFFGGLLFI